MPVVNYPEPSYPQKKSFTAHPELFGRSARHGGAVQAEMRITDCQADDFAARVHDDRLFMPCVKD
jgi:hypothetical protein